MNMKQKILLVTLLLVLSSVNAVAYAEDSQADLAKKLSNPIANLISVPMQYNYDKDMSLNDRGERAALNIQPVIPFDINEDWNLISRTIVPIIDQDNIIPGTDQSGLGDITQSIFFSPKAPRSNGWIWGAVSVGDEVCWIRSHCSLRQIR